AFARVVEGAAEPAELSHDHAPGALEPCPGPFEKRLAADLLARAALRDQLLLDDVLGRDAGMVVPGLPERVEAPHAMPADEAVLHRAVERVAHVELTRDVGRRDADHECLGQLRAGGLRSAGAGTGAVEALRLPELLPARLDPVRVVPRIHRGCALGVHRTNLDE